MRVKLLIGFLLLIIVDTFIPIGFKLAGNSLPEPALEWAWVEGVLAQPWVWGALAGYGAAFVIYMTILKYAPIGPAFAASHMDLATVTLFSFLYFGDVITPMQALGCVTILAGVLVLAATETDH